MGIKELIARILGGKINDCWIVNILNEYISILLRFEVSGQKILGSFVNTSYNNAFSERVHRGTYLG